MRQDILTFHHRYFPSSIRERIFFSPGRVNLIGEHIDYLGGNVLPFAIVQGNLAAFSSRQDDKILLVSDAFESVGIIHSSLSNTNYDSSNRWANYVIGCVDLAKKKGYSITHGFEMSILSDLPSGAGLSSSASIEVLTLTALSEINHWNLLSKDIALMAKDVENEYIGVKCGIMDQFVIAHAKKDKAVWLNTSTLEYTIVDAHIEGTTYVIADTGKKRGLVDSKYNARRQETSFGLQLLQKEFPIQQICDLSSKNLSKIKQFVTDDTVFRRVRHAITENERVKASIKAIVSQDPIALGKLLEESHQSLKNDFEVSCDELDKMVEISKSLGSYGARMTGAGFGGCTIHLVNKSHVNHFMQELKQRYDASTGMISNIFETIPSEGVREIHEK